MRYILPDGKVVDLGIYSLDDCEPLTEDEITQNELADILFKQTGILVANEKGGDNNGSEESTN